MLLFDRDRPRFLWVCFRLTVLSQFRCGSADPYSRNKVGKSTESPPGHPVPTQSCAASQPCSTQLTVLLLHHLLKWGPKSPICCQDSGFLSQQHLLHIPDFLLHNDFDHRLISYLEPGWTELLLCFVCKLTLQLFSRWNIHVPRHPSSLCRDWMCVWIEHWREYCSLH